jgi:hypothetical protein
LEAAHDSIATVTLLIPIFLKAPADGILRIDSVLQSELTLDWAKIPKLKIDPAKIRINAELAPALGSAADMSKAVSIDLEKIPEAFRLQRLLFLASRKAFLNMESKIIFSARKNALPGSTLKQCTSKAYLRGS